jgi:D-threo-aldose 1-dehydrogenase
MVATAGAVATRALGSTGLTPTIVGIGTSALGSMPQVHGYSVTERRAADALNDALAGPFTFIDTGADYGDGRSETRIAAALDRVGARDRFIIATKVDPDPTGRFDGQQVIASVHESLQRLGASSVPLLHLHDPERISFETAMAPGGAVEALVKLKESGVAESIGVAGGPASLLVRYVETGLFDVVQTHNRFTLLDRTAEPLIACATRLGVGVLNAAPYGGGLLTDTPHGTRRYAYRYASDETLNAAARMRQAAVAAGVPLAAAALQFSTRDPRIASTIVGMSRPGRAAATARLLGTAIPEELWAELSRLVPDTTAWLND